MQSLAHYLLETFDIAEQGGFYQIDIRSLKGFLRPWLCSSSPCKHPRFSLASFSKALTVAISIWSKSFSTSKSSILFLVEKRASSNSVFELFDLGRGLDNLNHDTLSVIHDAMHLAIIKTVESMLPTGPTLFKSSTSKGIKNWLALKHWTWWPCILTCHNEFEWGVEVKTWSNIAKGPTLLLIIKDGEEPLGMLGSGGGGKTLNGESGAWVEDSGDSKITTLTGLEGRVAFVVEGEPETPTEVLSVATLLLLDGLKLNRMPLSKEGVPFWD